MSEHSLDETMADVGRSARLAMMMLAQAGEQASRRIADAQREAAQQSAGRAVALREELAQAQEAARAVYQPVTDPRTFAAADAETIAGAWTTAQAWAEVDPKAAAAEAAIQEQVQQRWGLSPEVLREEATPNRQGTGADTDRLAEVMDPEWRDRASTEELEQRWKESAADRDRPGATEALAALEDELAGRLGTDVEKVRAFEERLTETVVAAAGDAAAADADRAAEASERASAAGWENLADSERHQEADPGAEPGQQVEDSVDAREAEGEAAQALAAAGTEHSRADQEAMDRAGVPARSQQVRTSTARGFGTSTQDGVRARGRARGQAKTTRGAKADRTHDRGR